MQQYDMETFLGRSMDIPIKDIGLFKVLDKLPKTSFDGPWLAGGSIRRTILKQKLDSDFDFFFANEEQLKDFEADLKDLGFTLHKQTEHHCHYKGKLEGSDKTIDVQCIKFLYYKNVEELLDSFDYTICQFAYDGSNLYTGDYSLWDLGRNKLAINKITFPVSTARRLIKYTSQGFVACNGCLNSIVSAVAVNPELRTDIAYVD